MSKKVCLITGVGPGTGTALAEEFSSEYSVAMIARDETRLRSLEDRLEGARGRMCGEERGMEGRVDEGRVEEGTVEEETRRERERGQKEKEGRGFGSESPPSAKCWAQHHTAQ